MNIFSVVLIILFIFEEYLNGTLMLSLSIETYFPTLPCSGRSWLDSSNGFLSFLVPGEGRRVVPYASDRYVLPVYLSTFHIHLGSQAGLRKGS